MLPALVAQAQEPVRVIFDTDMGNDCDDALALAILHAFETRGECKILAVTVTKSHPLSAALCERINAHYSRPEIPVGLVANGKTPEMQDMLKVAGLKPRAAYPNATDLLLSTLRRQPDGSVVIVQVGFSTNLARLLESPEGRELAQKKVRLLSVMAGAFPSGPKEFNVWTDIPSARKVFGEWPGPIVFSGFEIGKALPFPATAIANDFRSDPANPVVEAYKLFRAFPHDRPTWDLTAALYAVRPDRKYFDVSEPGDVTVTDDGRTEFHANPSASRRYLILRPDQKDRALEALVLLSSQPARSK